MGLPHRGHDKKTITWEQSQYKKKFDDKVQITREVIEKDIFFSYERNTIWTKGRAELRTEHFGNLPVALPSGSGHEDILDGVITEILSFGLVQLDENATAAPHEALEAQGSEPERERGLFDSEVVSARKRLR